jgi:TolB-like protein
MAPRDVRPGTVYADAIVRAINEAQALVLALSAGAMASSHVGREVERAAAKKKHIIAFRIDAAPLSPELEYFLSNSQWIDAPTLGMPAALAKLAEAVGQRSTGANAGGPGVPTRKRKRSPLAILTAMGLGVGASLVLGIYLWTSIPRAQAPAAAASGLGANAPTGPQISDKSIAVLPFADMSEKKDQEYFADGMAEEILDLLAKIPGLHVPARTSSFYFKGKSEDIPTIARRLMVANVLEGSVRKTGDRVRITVQLVRADNGYHLWSETYAEAEVEKARALDPSSTTALTQAGGLAMLRSRPNDALQLWEQATILDPLNSDAQMYLALVHYVLGQFAEAEVAARKAVDLNPLEPGSHLPLVQTLLALGKRDAALAEIERESALGYREFALARAYIILGRKADADAALSQLEKTFGAEHPYSIATLHALRGEHDEGFLWLDKAYAKHDPELLGMPSFPVEPDLQSLRGDPRYKAFLRKMKLPE